MNTGLWIILITCVGNVGFWIGTYFGWKNERNDIRKSLVRTKKYRLDEEYVINGSVDAEILKFFGQ